MSGNPFYIQPVDVSSQLAGLGKVLGDVQERKQKQQRMDEFRDAMTKAETPTDFANLAATYPEYGQAANLGLTAKAKELGMQKQSMVDLYRSLYISDDPMATYEDFLEANPDVKLSDSLIEDIGMALQDLDKFKRNIAVMWASTDPDGWKAVQDQQKAKQEADKAKTEQDWERKKWQSEQDWERKKWQSEQDWEKSKFEQEQQLELDKLDAEEAAKKAEEAAKKAEEDALSKEDIERYENSIMQAESGINAIDEFMANEDWIESIEGWSGKGWSLTDAGVEAEGAFDSIKAMLTLDNLKLMKGPLTDSDIKILTAAATRLRPGMSRKGMLDELERIRSTLEASKARAQKNLSGYPPVTEEAIQLFLRNPNDPQEQKEFEGVFGPKALAEVLARAGGSAR